MGNPQRFLVRVLLFLVFAMVVAVVLLPVLERAFLYNPWLNGLIFACLLIGVFYNLRRIWSLRSALAWLDGAKNGLASMGRQEPPRLLAPIAAALIDRDRRNRAPVLSPTTLRHLLDSTAARLEESRDIARYLTGLLIFLGLLGTFWGLLEAINSIGGVISGLSIGGEDFAALFDEMKSGLARPLTGMGTAFGSSLFGLAGSLVLGFLDLQASQAQNGFLDELEDWLAGITRHQIDAPRDPATGGSQVAVPALPASPPLPSYVQALLQQTAENLDRVHDLLAREEDQRNRLAGAIEQMSGTLAAMNDRLGREQDGLVRLAQMQQTIAEEMTRRGTQQQVVVLDEASQGHMRNLDLQLARVAELVDRGRVEAVRELRSEIRLVSRTIAAAAGEPQLVRD